jgi:hypothetical protein
MTRTDETKSPAGQGHHVEVTQNDFTVGFRVFECKKKQQEITQQQSGRLEPHFRGLKPKTMIPFVRVFNCIP